jgi:ABC-type uncharacterized transport system ATPase subunit
VSTAGNDAVLTLSGITKRFGSTVALDDVSLRVRRGTIHALLGENGAGKSTLMRVAFGLVTPDAGRIEIDGSGIAISSAADAIAAGVGMVHQHFTNVPAMTVAQNVALGGRGSFDAASAIRLVEEIGARTGLRLDATARAEQLPVGAQQRLEIVKSLARGARILILDEPTAVLAPSEAEELLRWLTGFARGGNAVVLITHKLREAIAIADDVTVLRRGRLALSAPAAAVTTSSLTLAMLGQELIGAEPSNGNATRGDVVASAKDIALIDERGTTVVRSATFDISAGEIVGIAAVEGAGQRELLRALAARAPVARGELRLPIEIGFVPEDRQRDALVLDFSPSENVMLKSAAMRRGRIAWQRVRERTRSLVRDFDVRGASDRAPVRALSGGNQQKLVLARELDGAPAMLVVENPTRGLDIRATREVHERLRTVAASGTAVGVYSSDLDEVLSLATRVWVLHAGSIRESPHEREAVGRAMLGVA